jgi:mannose-6-phosphate isomerase-like protein (cupin superfamily)
MSSTIEPVHTDERDPRGAEKKEAYHRTREEMRRSFSYHRPDGIPEDCKATIKMARADNEDVVMQILNGEGGENLHYHANMDSVFFVLKGRVRFYGRSDAVIGEYGPLEGLINPSGARYRFEKLGDEEVLMLQVGIYPEGRKAAKRLDASPPFSDQKKLSIDAATGERVWKTY